MEISFAARLLAMPKNNGRLLFCSDCITKTGMRLPRHPSAALVTASMPNSRDLTNIDDSNGGVLDGKTSKGSGTTARGRRLIKVREEKRKREYDRLHNYPAWAKLVRHFCFYGCNSRENRSALRN